jgi:hypothetical protein
MTFFTKFVEPVASPADTTCFMFFGDAEANTSAGAPLVIWVASVELAPKLNVTFVPGFAASNCWPMVVNASFSDEAANTVIDPDSAAEDDADADGDAEVVAGAALVVAGAAVLLDELLLEEQADSARTVIEASPRAVVVTLIRRIDDSLLCRVNSVRGLVRAGPLRPAGAWAAQRGCWSRLALMTGPVTGGGSRPRHWST